MALVSVENGNSLILFIITEFQTQKSPQRELRAFSSLSPGLSGITGDLFGLGESEFNG